MQVGDWLEMDAGWWLFFTPNATKHTPKSNKYQQKVSTMASTIRASAPVKAQISTGNYRGPQVLKLFLVHMVLYRCDVVWGLREALCSMESGWRERGSFFLCDCYCMSGTSYFLSDVLLQKWGLVLSIACTNFQSPGGVGVTNLCVGHAFHVALKYIFIIFAMLLCIKDYDKYYISIL